MGQRHLFNTSPMFETDHDRSWNHMCANQPYVRLGTGLILFICSFVIPFIDIVYITFICISFNHKEISLYIIFARIMYLKWHRRKFSPISMGDLISPICLFLHQFLI